MSTARSSSALAVKGSLGGRWTLVAVWMAVLAVIRSAEVEERDPYWQARAGWENLTGTPLSRPDTWSWAPVDTLFLPTSPGWNAVLGVGEHLAGYAGIFLVALGSIGAYLGVTVALCRALGARPIPTLVALLAVFAAVLAMFSPRATVLAQTIFLVGLLFVRRFRSGDRSARPLTPVVLGLGGFVVSVVGNWVHLSWTLLAGASALAWTAIIWLSPGAPSVSARITQAASAVVGHAAGVFAGPYGMDAWQVSQQVRDACEGLITEWKGAFSAGLTARWLPVLLLAVGISLVTFVWLVRRWRQASHDPRVALVAALACLGIPTAFAGVQAIRFLGLSLMTLAPVVAVGVTWLADRAHARAEAGTGLFAHRVMREWSSGRPWAVVFAITLVLLVPGAALISAPLARPTPEAALVDALPRDCRLFSDPGAAAPVLLDRPDVTVWIDSRFDYYGRDRLVAALGYYGGRSPALVPPGTTCVLLVESGNISVGGLRDALDAAPGWRRAATAGAGAVWVPSA